MVRMFGVLRVAVAVVRPAAPRFTRKFASEPNLGNIR
jgi:hypothetical protein